MNILVPNYYYKFKCIADKCKHNCCIGWEIDIDKNTLKKYDKVGGDLGMRLKNSLDITSETPHFILEKGDRCPFLNERGLCDIISGLGEDYLCDICADHPRFRNFYTSFTEMGLGVCCEEAARLILGGKEEFNIVALETDGEILCNAEENFVLNVRNKLFKILKRRDITIEQRFSQVSKEFNFTGFSLENLCDTYLSLERLDNKWTDIIEDLKKFSFSKEIFRKKEFQIPFEQLACYFLFRHLPDAIWDGEIAARVKLCLAGCFLLGAICEKHEITSIEGIAEFARMYSAEVEYSQENINTLICVL